MNAANNILVSFAFPLTQLCLAQVMLVLLVTTAALETETPIVKANMVMEADAEWRLRTYGSLTDQSELAVRRLDLA